jgi:NADH dehydrogenase [ubiquinone] 1 alpha subcomplex assembly factor 1
MRVKGDARQWFVNIQSDSLFPKSLYQHKLEFKTVGEWETIMVYFADGLTDCRSRLEISY